MACEGDVVVSKGTNAAPTVLISSHAEGGVFCEVVKPLYFEPLRQMITMILLISRWFGTSERRRYVSSPCG